MSAVRASDPSSSRPLRYLVLSRHDYGSARRANVHFIARELAKRGPTRFFSSSFSLISRLKRDHRMPLWAEANEVRRINGVETFLWKTLLHPFKIPDPVSRLMDGPFDTYVSRAPEILKRWAAESDVIVIESGGPEIFFELVRRINPAAKIVYNASDALDVIGAAPQVRRSFSQVIRQFDTVRLPSPLMANDFPSDSRLFVIPHGLDSDALATAAASPYRSPTNVVSVGNMLFDPGFFEVVSRECPEVTFHVIGGGAKARRLTAPNIKVLPETPFTETLPYLKFADAGVAPYGGEVPSYLTDTSLKIMQYAYYGLPTICPRAIARNHEDRFGYDPADPQSYAMAVRAALAHDRFPGRSFFSWTDVVERMLAPEAFADTRLN